MTGMSDFLIGNIRSRRQEFLAKSLVALIFLKCIGETIELEERGVEYVPFDKYRIQNDPTQVKPDRITTSNLFSWLNLKNSVRFRLWTRKNPELAHEIKYNNLDSLLTSNFDARRVTKIIIHGFADTATEVAVSTYLFDIRDAYLHLADLNVLIVDYSLFTMPIFYYTSLPDLAAIRLEEFIKFLLTNSNLRMDSLHLVGFSLGAHVAGLAGHRLNGTIGRITGLDPAGPSFHYVSNALRLDSSDAKFVDIIHTNAGKRFLGDGNLGISESLGHVDFYPNGGSLQVGCTKPTILTLSYKNLECSHGRAARYFIESITSPLAFPACRCESLQKYVNGDCTCGNAPDGTRTDKDGPVYMGEHCNLSIRGIFQLVTNSQRPFGNGPNMDVSLPNGTHCGFSLCKTEVNSLVGATSIETPLPRLVVREDEATIVYKNTKVKVKYKNTFNAIDIPNDDILTMCHNLLKNTKVLPY